VEKSVFTKEYETLILRLRQARRTAGFTQHQVAERLNPTKGLSPEKAKKQKQVMQRFVSRCECGDRRVDVVELYFLCKATGIDFLDLMRQMQEDLERRRKP
jgi:transcriptional regulator with XRE-family HTH domain